MNYKTTIRVPIYDTSLKIILSDNISQYSSGDPDDYSGKMQAFISMDKHTGNVTMHFEEFEPRVIVHESVHAANRILLNKGIIADFDNDEAQAYLVDWIFDQCDRFITKCLRKEETMLAQMEEALIAPISSVEQL